MEAPHKAHHKPSAGAKHAKKDAAKGVDRSGGKNFNPKVRTSPLHSLILYLRFTGIHQYLLQSS